MTESQARRACREYYLDCRSIEKIAHDMGVTKRAVRSAIDDVSLMSEYLQVAERTRKRTKARAAQAADLALEKQVEFLGRDVGDKLLPAQQQTARSLMAFGLRDADDRSEIRITFAGGDIKIGMPRRKSEAQSAGLCDADS